MMFSIKKIHSEGEHHRYGRYTYCDVDKDDGTSSIYVKVWHQSLGKEEAPDWRACPSKMIVCDYGYCTTVHKYQGSESEKVMVVDEQCDKWEAARWRYTAFTRASQRLEVFI